jgi:hypothetical protein
LDVDCSSDSLATVALSFSWNFHLRVDDFDGYGAQWCCDNFEADRYELKGALATAASTAISCAPTPSSCFRE